MELETIVDLIMRNGLGVAIVVYFLFKDYRFNEHIINVLTELKEILAGMRSQK